MLRNSTSLTYPPRPSSEEMRMPDSPVEMQSANDTPCTPPDISDPIVKPPRHPEATRRTLMLRDGRAKCCPAQFHPDLIATASSPAQ